MVLVVITQFDNSAPKPSPLNTSRASTVARMVAR